MAELVPAVFRCRKHDTVLTPQVVAKVESVPVRVTGSGLRDGSTRGVHPFRVVVQCPGGGGHDLVFRGTHRP